MDRREYFVLYSLGFLTTQMKTDFHCFIDGVINTEGSFLFFLLEHLQQALYTAERYKNRWFRARGES
jgi:hypothetical protein